MRRHHVHLSPDIAAARRVGARRGAPVILAIRALDLHATGTLFHLTTNHVWLTAAVPPAFLDVVEGADQAGATRSWKWHDGVGLGHEQNGVELRR